MTKNETRRLVLEQRASILDEDRDLWDQLIFERAHKLRAFQIAQNVHVYRAVRDEVETMHFIEYAWGIGKNVYVPVVPPGKSEMIHCKVTWHSLWRDGSFGIPEPIINEDSCVISDHSFFDNESVVIAPLVAFDRQCHRIGYGKGYYDRFLASTKAPSVGLAYEIQRVLDMTPESHDVALTCVATQERWYLPTI
ncbi:MAG: 5-formyltetrahydrofolate cyclo-ligase [Candidatus Kapabacteria bacterium]|nr:5-formyltetrahydrofolate cyclo-ligase [Candidatus Kapabacteria bacterium]